MNRSEREEFDVRAENNHRLARHRNVASADNIFVNTSKGRRFYKAGVGQRKASDGKR